MYKGYTSISRFEELIAQAKNICEAEKIAHNLFLRCHFPVALINAPFDGIYEDKAAQWQQSILPNNLHINHGQFIHAKGDGIQHIIDELKRKGDSNRALYSLISMSDIVGKGDLPIPSFMVLQFGIADKYLFCTAYFRALEISRFLTLNITEICIVIRKIRQSIPNITDVFLCIHAFRGYVNEEFDCLEKSLLDQLEVGTICGFLTNSDKKDRVRECLISKLKESTVIETARLMEMCNFLKNSRPTTKSHYSDLFLCALEKATESLVTLKALREKSSYSEEIQATTDDYKRYMRNAIAALNS